MSLVEDVLSEPVVGMNSVKIGIGIPSPAPGTRGTRLIEWAKRAEERGFSGLATIDRIAHPSYHPEVVRTTSLLSAATSIPRGRDFDATLDVLHRAWRGGPALGADAEDASRAYLRDYYAFVGGYADQIAEGALRSEQAIGDGVRAFSDIGITEFYFDPTASSLDQVDRLADLVF
jgi:hypothetical protein